jgi:dTMP kinase
MSKFITFEGCEGSGKSTQSKLLYQAFLNSNIKTILTREPGGTEAAEEIRNLLLHGKLSFLPITQILLHNASRYEHVTGKILPSLAKGEVVICDRFLDSTISYQGYGYQLGKDFPGIIHNIVMKELMPDFTFILDVDPSQGLTRARAYGDFDNYEKLDLSFHQRVREGFLEIAAMNKNRCFVISADNTIENIHKEIIDIVNANSNFNLEMVK